MYQLTTGTPDDGILPGHLFCSPLIIIQLQHAQKSLLRYLHVSNLPHSLLSFLLFLHFAQLTDSHCRYLGGMFVDKDGLRHITTFLDGDTFSEAYGIGEDNCGFEVVRRPKGTITACDNGLVTDAKDDISDIVGRYTVIIDGKTYDTVRLIDMQFSRNSCMMCEYYLGRNGRTVLWRRFNKDDWAIERYGKKWTEALPDNEKITINGDVYVHWYDCITASE